MNIKLFAATLVAVGALAATAKAQEVIVVPDDVDSYVAEQPFDDSATYEEEFGVGDTLPESVIIREVPAHDDYGVAVVNRQRVVVEPRTRRVIKIYE